MENVIKSIKARLSYVRIVGIMSRYFFKMYCLKYKAWLELNSRIVELRKDNEGEIEYKYMTEERWTKKKYTEWKFAGNTEYDLMHFTFIVPSFENENPTDHFNLETMNLLYNRMRKECMEWKRLVLGGESLLEFKYEYNRCHIEMHSLLLVRRETENQNKLHSAIMEYWNKTTIIFHLKDIFTYTKDVKKGSSLAFSSIKTMLRVMKSIVYRFQPFENDKETGKYMSLIIRFFPDFRFKRTGYRFGCLYCESSLGNVSVYSDQI